MRITKASKAPAIPGGSTSKTVMQKRLARQAAMERDMSRYPHLTCGHYSTLETQQLYGEWRPKRGIAWCEKCNDWMAVARPPAPPVYPAQPLF